MDGGETDNRQPFGAHIKELKQRLGRCLIALIIGAGIGYAIHNLLLDIIREPLQEQLYYTSPLGGLNAIILISIVFGLIVSLPIFIYQIIRFINPALPKIHTWTRGRIFGTVLFSIILAALGASFAYFISLPAALHFLTNISATNLQPFITINEYLRFALSYIAGFALLFQLPLIMMIINRIKPLTPGGMMKYQRYVILGSVVIAAILTPTPDPLNQLSMAVPVIILYQFSMLWIMAINRKKTNKTSVPVKSGVKPVQKTSYGKVGLLTASAVSQSVAQRPLAQPSTGTFIDGVHMQHTPSTSSLSKATPLQHPGVVDNTATDIQNDSQGEIPRSRFRYYGEGQYQTAA